VAPPVGEQREGGGPEHADGADEAVAAAVTAAAGGAVEQLVPVHPQRQLELERLDRRVQRVRHADVDAGRPVAPLRRALAAAERLVVRPARTCRSRRCSSSLALRGTSAACASASRTVSAIRWLVSTFPATTAEGGARSTRQPSGARIVDAREEAVR
jgi:hypothetical protein